jgi:surface polysaccharide O-acyltransferase-like enzyme
MMKKLLILNGLAILVIPIHHAAAYGLQAMFFWTDRYLPVTTPNFDQLGTFHYQVTMVIRQLDAFAVPAFLFISGFFIAFLARSDKSSITWKTMLPRIKILIFPFLIWTVIRYILLRRPPSGIDEALNPYHFIPLLIQFYILSPFLVPIAKKRPALLLIGAAIIHLSVQGLRYFDGLGINFPGLEILLQLTPRWIVIGQQPFWFPFGLVVGLNFTKFQEWLARTNRWFLVGTVTFGFLAVLEYQVVDYLNGGVWLNPAFGGFTRTFYILAFILWFLALDENSIPFTNILSKLSARSLGIYLANIPTVYVTAVLMYRFTPWVLGNQLLYQLILFSAGLGGPLLLMEVIRRSPMRKGYRHLFG